MRRSFDAMPAVRDGDTFKFMPKNPPHRGEVVLIRGERCVVTRARVRWDGPRWELLRLRVRRLEPSA